MYPVGKDLAEELHQLSGWEYDLDGSYSLSLMLRKLRDNEIYPILEAHLYEKWWMKYGYMRRTTLTSPAALHTVADTPEDAACKLAIELFKQGIVK